MRVELVDNLLVEDRGRLAPSMLQPPLGLLSLISVLEAGGHSARLYDPKLALFRGELELAPGLYQRMADQILAREPDVLGFSMWGTSAVVAIKVAELVKRARPNLPILAGGPHATIIDRELLASFPQFDLVLRNEAELTILPVLNALRTRRFDGLLGVTYRTTDGEVVANPGSPVIDDLDRLPRVAYHQYPIRELRLQQIRIEGGRGCPFECSFCSTSEFFGRRYRIRSAESLRAEMDYLYETFGIRSFSINHDLFTVNKKKVAAFCRAILSRGYSWSCSARTDCVDVELLELMRAAGCTDIYYGVETGSARIQRLVHKNLDLDKFRTIFNETVRIGIRPTVSFITGYPEETRIDQNETLDLIGECFHRSDPPPEVQYHLLCPEPGTKLLKEYRHLLAFDGHVSDFNFPPLEPDDTRLMQSYPAVFVNHYHFETASRPRDVFVTDVYRVLYRLGHPVLAHLRWVSGGRFSLFVGEMFDWYCSTCPGNPINEELVIQYAQHRFANGRPDAYIGSLLRYQMTGVLLSARLENARVDTGGLLRSSNRLAVLPSLHDVPALLAEIAARPDNSPPEVQRAETADRVLVYRGAGGRECVQMFTVNALTLRVIKAFDRPTTVRDALATLSELPAGPRSELPAFVAALTKNGLLVPAPAVSATSPAFNS